MLYIPWSSVYLAGCMANNACVFIKQLYAAAVGNMHPKSYCCLLSLSPILGVVRCLADLADTQFIATTFWPEILKVVEKIYRVTAQAQGELHQRGVQGADPGLHRA